MGAPSYNLLDDFGGSADDVSTSPCWAVVVVRLGIPLSFSRKNLASTTKDVSQGGRLRGPNLVIVSDCKSITITGSKDSHTKSMVAELIQTDHNYLVEILPGDWVLAWLLHDQTHFDDLLGRIRKGEACNGWDDGLKFVGRADSIRKRVSVNRSTGMKSASVTLSAVGFRELDTMFYYNQFLSEHGDADVGTWLTKLGVDLDYVFSASFKEGQKNNARQLVTTLMDLIVGKGVKPVERAGLRQTGTEAPFAYLVPRVVGAFLGLEAPSNDPNDQLRVARNPNSKESGILSYADILTTLMGVQTYSESDGGSGPESFVPKLTDNSTTNRMLTDTDLLGTFIPVMPPFTNKPLWNVLETFKNPAVNEMYTCLRPNREGRVMPTFVFRQIPFTTDAFTSQALTQKGAGPLLPGQSPDSLDITPEMPVTKFLNLPRWVMPTVLVSDVDIGRSDATRINFVQVYGQDINTANGVTFPQQTATNPPIRDDLDIQRAGLRPYIMSVACAIKDTIGRAPSAWMALVADRTMGSQYSLNGMITCIGIPSPIAEGDNLEFGDTVYHIEGVTHHASVDTSGGTRTWITSLTLSNGMRKSGGSDTDAEHPVYPGLKPGDETGVDPRTHSDDRYDRTPPNVEQGDLANPNRKLGSKAGDDAFGFGSKV